MILVIGPMAAGKREFVLAELGYAAQDLADGVLDGRPVICNVQELAFQDPEGAPALLPALAAKEVVVMNEVGSGIIPAERRQREAREAAGRLGVLLAREAERVYRVSCGIPQRIK